MVLHQPTSIQLIAEAALCLCTDRYEDSRVLIPLGNFAVIGPSVFHHDDSAHSAIGTSRLAAMAADCKSAGFPALVSKQLLTNQM